MNLSQMYANQMQESLMIGVHIVDGVVSIAELVGDLEARKSLIITHFQDPEKEYDPEQDNYQIWKDGEVIWSYYDHAYGEAVDDDAVDDDYEYSYIPSFADADSYASALQAASPLQIEFSNVLQRIISGAEDRDGDTPDVDSDFGSGPDPIHALLRR